MMSMFKKIVLATAAVVLILGRAEAGAAVITFEGHGNDGAVVEFQDGFTFSFNAAGWGIFEDSFVGGGAPYTHNGTTRLMASGDRSGSTAFVDIFRTDLADFSIAGFDAATMFPGYTGRIEAIRSVGGIPSGSVFFDLSDTFATFALPGSFSGISGIRVRDTFSVAFRGGPGSFALDNLKIGVAAVPEPATLTLMGIGLLGMGMARRRRRR